MTNQKPNSIRAAVVKDFNKGYEVRDVDVPTDLGSNNIIIRIAAAGYCHTDLQMIQGVYESDGAKPSLIGSHEPAKTVSRKGQMRDNTTFRRSRGIYQYLQPWSFCSL
jgi:D-arabinose 1-dehydrogenase-like Zn-dependent alcohol dehydrogenase